MPSSDSKPAEKSLESPTAPPSSCGRRDDAAMAKNKNQSFFARAPCIIQMVIVAIVSAALGASFAAYTLESEYQQIVVGLETDCIKCESSLNATHRSLAHRDVERAECDKHVRNMVDCSRRLLELTTNGNCPASTEESRELEIERARVRKVSEQNKNLRREVQKLRGEKERLVGELRESLSGEMNYVSGGNNNMESKTRRGMGGRDDSKRGRKSMMNKPKSQHFQKVAKKYGENP